MDLELINGRDLILLPTRVQPWVVQSFLGGGVTLFAGEPKVGKSTFAMQVAHAVANEKPLLGQFRIIKPGRVLWCGLEETDAILKDRQRGIDEDLDNWALVDYVKTPVLVEPGPKLVEAIKNKLLQREYSMAVVDPLLMAREPANQGDIYGSDYRAVAAFNNLSNELDIPLLMIHHTNKNKEGGDGQHRISGSHGLSAAATTNMVLTAGSGETMDGSTSPLESCGAVTSTSGRTRMACGTPNHRSSSMRGISRSRRAPRT